MSKHLPRLLSSLPNAAVVLLALALIAGGIYAYRELFTSRAEDLTILGSLEYGAPECFNGTLWMMFFNPGDLPVYNVSVFSGDAVYISPKSLEPDTPAAFPLGPCGSIDVSRLTLSYCAGLCKVEPLAQGGKSGDGASKCPQVPHSG